jgi:hypothetical protein
MATRAEIFRYHQERRGPKRPKRPRRPRRDRPVDTAKPGVSATDRKVGQGATAERNRSESAARKAPYKLEDSRTRPSRKTTRRGANRMRQDAELRKRQTASSRSPSKRAFRNTATKQGVVPRKVRRRRRAR